MIATERVLFDGRLGTQRVRVWLERRGTGIAMLSHDIGPALEHAFGRDEIETFLEVEDRYLPALTAALAPSASARDVLDLLADRYRGDSAATTRFREWLSEQRIPYRFTIV